MNKFLQLLSLFPFLLMSPIQKMTAPSISLKILMAKVMQQSMVQKTLFLSLIKTPDLSEIKVMTVGL